MSALGQVIERDWPNQEPEEGERAGEGDMGGHFSWGLTPNPKPLARDPVLLAFG